jgi:hypothetical protein
MSRTRTITRTEHEDDDDNAPDDDYFFTVNRANGHDRKNPPFPIPFQGTPRTFGESAEVAADHETRHANALQHSQSSDNPLNGNNVPVVPAINRTASGNGIPPPYSFRPRPSSVSPGRPDTRARR